MSYWTEKEKLAMYFAIAAHEAVQQKRKYTGLPYWTHCESVAGMVKAVGGDENMVCAAWLHDTVEDTGVNINTIQDLFGKDVADLVSGLTDVSTKEDGNRAKRKEIDRMHTTEQSARCKTIKLCDLIDNASSILQYDREFAEVYIKEKELLLEVLKEGDERLWKKANDIVQKAKIELEIDSTFISTLASCGSVFNHPINSEICIIQSPIQF